MNELGYTLIELNPDYAQLVQKRITDAPRDAFHHRYDTGCLNQPKHLLEEA